ncbi:MAG: hypothetical protein ACLQVX_14855 [Limisphaerales bacterium]
MIENTTVGKNPIEHAGEAGGDIEESGDVALAAAPEVPSKTACAGKIWPRWLGLLFGRLTLRVCSPEKAGEACAACGLKPFCRCAQEDWNAACAVESWFWIISTIGVGALMLVCLL